METLSIGRCSNWPFENETENRKSVAFQLARDSWSPVAFLVHVLVGY